MKVKLFIVEGKHGNNIDNYKDYKEYKVDIVDIVRCKHSDANVEVELFYMGSGKFKYDEVHLVGFNVNEQTKNIINSYKNVDSIPMVKFFG